MSPIGTDHRRTRYIRDSKPLVDRTFLEVHGFSEGKGAVRDRRGAYFLDIRGRPTGNERYRRTYPYHNGVAAAEDDLGMFHMDSDGNELYSRRFGWVSIFSDGLCAVRYRNGKYTYIDTDGNPWDATYRYCGDFSEGYGTVLEDEGFRIVDKQGNLLFDRSFEECGIFDNGLIPVKEKGRWRLLDKNGDYESSDMDFIESSGNGLFTAIGNGYRHYFSRNRGWVPMHRMMDAVDHNEIPRWTDDILDSDWDSCVVFMRHSERTSHYLCDSMDIGKADLTPHGDELARSIGKKIASLGNRKVRGYCSNSRRCITTANCIMGGMGVQSKVDISPEVGLMGTAYIYDGNFSAEDMRCPGTVWMERGLKGDMIHGWYPYEKVLGNIYDMMERLLADDGTLTFCVNHDLFVIPPIAYITGRFAQDDWVEYCEGFLFIRKGNSISMVWKGKEYPVSPDMLISIDSSPLHGYADMDLERPSEMRSWMFHESDDNAWIGTESEGKFTACDKEGRFFHGRTDEFTVCNRTFAFARDFSEQCAPIYMDGRGASYITDFGDYLNNRWFLDTRCYREGLSAVRDEGGWQYADVDGRIGIKADLDAAYDFRHGESFVIRGGIPARMDREGTMTDL